ncbi:MAG: LamG domain-containing protein [Armatimonadetes bacterium]|nr:LamG domain-containing protein [Armatimonadota bacterium]
MGRTACVLTLAFSLLAATANAQIRPTLALDFEGNFDGQGAAGLVRATLDGKPALVDGKFGKALLSGPSTGYLLFPTPGIVNPVRGTVEMWVCPVDWDGTEEKFHVFFDARGQGAFYLYKYYQGGLLMLSCSRLEGPYHSASADIKSWKPGEWHHIAGTWRPTKQCVYVDGKLAGTVQPSLPASLDPTFRIGDHPWHIERASSSIIDRVRIYDRCLTDEEIAAHYRGEYERVFPVSEKNFDLTFDVNPDARRLDATLEIIGGAALDETGLSAEFSVAPIGGGEAVKAPASFRDGQASAELSLAALKPGAYRLTAAVATAAGETFRVSRDFSIPALDWMGNRIGLDEVVLPPWTPLSVRKGTSVRIRCWGREYTLAETGLPAQIRSAGADLLARPVALIVTAGGRPLQWEKGSIRIVSSQPAAADVEAVAEAPCGSGSATLRAKARAEYDGLLLTTLTLEMPSGVSPDAISLEIPLRPEVALYRHRYSPAWANITGSLPAGEGVVDSASFIPMAWIGDNDRGLFWFCERAEHWPNSDAPNAFETVRTASEVVMRFNLLAPGQRLPDRWIWEFGLQATPVKPIPKDWRKWRLTPARGANVEIIWPTPSPDSMKYYGYPEAANPKAFAERVKRLHDRGIKAVPYSCLTFLSAACPEFQWFKSKWWMGGGDASSSDVAAYGAMFAMVCPQAPGLGDFLVWKNRQFMERYRLDGFYHDNTHPYACALGPCAYTRDGTKRPTYHILAYRALYRRIYAMVKSQKRETFLMAHMSGKVTIPILAYEDAYLDGEHFRGQVKDSYLDLLPLDAFRAEFMGRQWGVMPFFLPEFTPPYSQQVEPTRGLAALLMLHDVSPWAIWCNADVFNEALAALDAFGYVKADFVPYFSPEPPAQTDLRDVYASAYRLAGKALVIVANLSREERAGTIVLNKAALGIDVGRVRSWPDRKRIAAAGGRVRLTIPPLGYRMLLVGEG